MNRNILIAATAALVLLIGVTFAINTYVRGGSSYQVEAGSCTGTCSDEVAAGCSAALTGGCTASSVLISQASCCPSESEAVEDLDTDFTVLCDKAVEFYGSEYGDYGVSAKVIEWTDAIRVGIIQNKKIIKVLTYESGVFSD
ncbi:MAG TPA: hypothetical protein PKV16_06805 [Caldisericia bacterium]|nr:hypothetical protein [Caldisericia bacterium]HPF49476.1 hypothetical protein [Caldisericia bacterium]HPI84230.1 hypothetical protein [Caldisericia bacterium]HPQ93475.1 hypothetical protein [Caldisericia bacterium]HRV75519.1 hypothetical protein [Caldisericia bacterium]